jgi:Helix-turn-helix domain
MTDVDRLYSFKQAIAMAGMRPTKAYQTVAAGRLRVVKHGRRTFVRASEIERFIASLEADTPRHAA